VRLDIPVNDPCLVSLLQSLACLNSDVESFIKRQAAFLDLCVKRRPIDEGHRNEGLFVFLVDTVDAADVGVIEGCGCLRFPDEAVLDLLVAEDITGKELECYRDPKLRVLGLVDNTHPALTELLGDLVVRDGSADHVGPILA